MTTTEKQTTVTLNELLLRLAQTDACEARHLEGHHQGSKSFQEIAKRADAQCYGARNIDLGLILLEGIRCRVHDDRCRCLPD